MTWESLDGKHEVYRKADHNPDEDPVYFVLDIANDPYARTALVTYADSIRYENYDFSEYLMGEVDKYDD